MPTEKPGTSETDASVPARDQKTGETKPVDQEVQKDAAEERKKEGGYD